MPHYNFTQDHKEAQKTEREISDKIFEWYGWKTIEFGRTNAFDLLVRKESRELRLEIKEDFTCRKTGNVGLEFECRGKPSGISVSKSSHYIYKLHCPDGKIRYRIISKTKLEKMIEEKKFFRVVNGGDKGSNSMNYLFKYNVFMNASKDLRKKKSSP